MTEDPPADSRASRRAREDVLDELAHWLDEAQRTMETRGGPFEIRAELSESLILAYGETGIGNIHRSRVTGGCLRVWEQDTPGFASTHDLSAEGTEQAADRAVRIAASGQTGDVEATPYRPSRAGEHTYAPSIEQDPMEADPAEIAGLLEAAYDAGAVDGDEGQTRAKFSARSRHVLYRDSSGRSMRTRFLVTSMQAHAVHKGSDRRGEGSVSRGGEWGLGALETHADPQELGREARQRAIESAGAQEAPSGRVPVLCDGHLAGVLAHESFGHLIEHDVVASGWSLLKGRRGDRFAPPNVNVVDAPAPPEGTQRGLHIPYDDEGTEGRSVRILDDGILRNWLHSRPTAAKENDDPTGNARAFNVRHAPIVRMRNTYFEPGSMSREEALEELGNGVYLKGSKGGAPESDGSFMFTAQRGYLVEDGEVTEPLREASIAGNILDFLEAVEGLTEEFSLHTVGMAGCAKWGQAPLPVATGGPHLLVSEALVGGGAQR